MLLAAVGIVVWGPRGQSEIPDGFVRVSYWEKWTGNEAEQMKQIVADFNRTIGREKKIFVEYMSMSEVHRKTLIAAAAGVPPDIAGLWDGQVVQFASLNALEPLDELAAEFGITRAHYKPAYWNLCTYDGRLWVLVSTPAAIALHYNKHAFFGNAGALRSEGLDPTRAPQTIAELDRYADVLTTFHPPGSRRLQRAGYLPVESWYTTHLPLWFGGRVYDPQAPQLTLLEPRVVRAYEWLQAYSLKLGKDSLVELRSGFGTYNSPQNPFYSDQVAMVQQGPWVANYVQNLVPHMSEVLVPKSLELFLPRVVRPFNYSWGVAPFPSDLPELEDVTYVAADVLMIPRGAKHKREAFEFIAYVQRQEVMEKLCRMHCKLSPLVVVSDAFIRTHPNPYIDIFERLAASPNAHGIPQTPIFPEIGDELNVMVQSVYLLQATPEQALRTAEQRLREKQQTYLQRQRLRAAVTD